MSSKTEQVERMLKNEVSIQVHLREKFNSWSKEEQEKYLEYNKLSPEQLETLKQYKEYYEDLPSSRGGSNKGTSVWNTITSIRRLGLYLKSQGIKDYKQATKQDIINYIRSLNGRSINTKSSYKTYIRMFYKWIYGIKDKHRFPEVVDDPRLVPERRKNNKKPQDLLTDEEIYRMLQNAISDRNRSIIMLSLGEGGLRAGEIVSLNISSVEFDERGCKVWIEKSKSKERYVRIIKGEPYLRDYINKEYLLDKSIPNNPLIYAVKYEFRGNRLRNSAIGEVLHRIAKRANIKKRVYTHLGRAINISKLNKMGMSAEISAKRFGIKPGTLRDVYLTIDDKDVDEVYSRIEGKLTDEELEKIKKQDSLLTPKRCPRCNKTLPINALYCNCGMIVNQEEAIRVQDTDNMFMQVLKKLKDISPDTLAQFVDTISKYDEKLKK